MEKNIIEAILKLAECIDALEFPNASNRYKTRKELITEILNKKHNYMDWEEEFDKLFYKLKEKQPDYFIDLKDFITDLLEQEKSKWLEEVKKCVPDESTIEDYRFNDCRSQLLTNLE